MCEKRYLLINFKKVGDHTTYDNNKKKKKFGVRQKIKKEKEGVTQNKTKSKLPSETQHTHMTFTIPLIKNYVYPYQSSKFLHDDSLQSVNFFSEKTREYKPFVRTSSRHTPSLLDPSWKRNPFTKRVIKEVSKERIKEERIVF